MINHPSRIIWVFFAIVAIIAVWSAASLVSGIEMRALRQRVHYGDPSKLKTPILAQSFLSTQDNLSRIEIRLAQPPATPIPSDTSLAAELIQGDNPAGTPLYTAPVAASQVITESGVPFLSFCFPPIAHSQGITYTFALQTNGSSVNSILLPAYSPIDALSSGAMYTEDGPQPGDLDIVTYYRYNLLWLAADTWNAVSSNLLPILAWLAVFLLPGLALLLWLPNTLSTGQKLMAAPALSALCIPLLYLAASIAGIPVGRNKLWALLALCALAIAARVVSRKSLIVSPFTTDDPPNDLRSSTYDLRLIAFWATFIAVMLITIATRLVSLRDIPAGEGIDAYHHTLVTALFLRDAGIPTGYAPFAPFASFTYHFGFHSLSATIAWLTGSTQVTDLMALVPRVGQIASCVLPIPSLVLFGWRVLGNRWVGLTAGAFTGLLSVVPAFYGEWSRYTQGLGLAVLPVAWVFFIEVLGRTTDDRRQTTGDASRIIRSSVVRRLPSIVRRLPSIALAVLSAAGLFLTHYRITIIYVALVGLYVAWRALVRWKLMRAAQSEPVRLSKYLASIAPDLLNTILIGLLTLLLLLPWLLNLRSNFVTNFIDKSGQNLDAYFATAERLGPAVLSHPSVVWLAILCALGLAVLGWQTWRSEGWGLLLGLIAGVPVIWAALYVYFSRDPIAIEADTRTTLLGLSPVTWLLLLETVLLALMLLGHTPTDLPEQNAHPEPTTGDASDSASLITYHVSRPSLVLLPALAWLILELWASPQLLPFHLPFVGYLDAVTLTSSAWLPACLLAAYAAVRTWNWVSHQADDLMSRTPTTNIHPTRPHDARPTYRLSLITYRLARPFLALTCLLFALASGLSLSPVNDRTPYIASADMEAFAWMRDNMPADSYVLSDSFSFPWSPNQVLGGDAGLWLPLTTGLRSSVPPISAYNEKPIDPAYFAQLQALAAARPDPGNEANWQTLEAAGITDIYVGTRSAGDGFDVEGLLTDPHVRLIFHRDGVWLFEISSRKS